MLNREEGNSWVKYPDTIAVDRANKTVPTYNNILGIRGFSETWWQGARRSVPVRKFVPVYPSGIPKSDVTHVRRTLTAWIWAPSSHAGQSILGSKLCSFTTSCVSATVDRRRSSSPSPLTPLPSPRPLPFLFFLFLFLPLSLVPLPMSLIVTLVVNVYTNIENNAK